MIFQVFLINKTLKGSLRVRCLFGGHSERGGAVTLEVSIRLSQFLAALSVCIAKGSALPVSGRSPALCQHSHL